MWAYIARRILLAALSIWVMSILSFLVIQLPPGDAVDRYIEQLYEESGGQPGMAFQTGPSMARDEADALRAYYGMDQPYPVRYLKWVWNLVNLDFGYSYLPASGGRLQPMARFIQDRVPLTVILTAVTVVFTFVVSFPAGIYSAMRVHTAGDYTLTFVGFIGISVPDFLLALVLMYIFFAYFDESVGGLFSRDMEFAPWGLAKAWDLTKHMFIPVVVLGTNGTAGNIRILRNNLLDELRKPYVVSARSKGLANWKVVVKYPLRVALNPMISNIGGLLPGLISGSVIVSVILGLQTIGPLFLSAIQFQDVYTAGFIILLLGILTITGVLISDIMLVIVDPRIRMWN